MDFDLSGSATNNYYYLGERWAISNKIILLWMFMMYMYLYPVQYPYCNTVLIKILVLDKDAIVINALTTKTEFSCTVVPLSKGCIYDCLTDTLSNWIVCHLEKKNIWGVKPSRKIWSINRRTFKSWNRKDKSRSRNADSWSSFRSVSTVVVVQKTWFAYSSRPLKVMMYNDVFFSGGGNINSNK